MSEKKVYVEEPLQEVLLEGRWQWSSGAATFRSHNASTGEPFCDEFPISTWADCDKALNAAQRAAVALRQVPPETTAFFLDLYADKLEENSTMLCNMACYETALWFTPRLALAELPRTADQLGQAAAAVRDGSWKMATIDKKLNIRSMLAPLGPVLIFGPNNFPFAFNAVSGGDFAAAIAAGNPVIAKAHPLHPITSINLASLAHDSAKVAGFPLEAVQMLYELSPADGLRMAGDPRLAAIAFTGSRAAGLALKAAAEKTGRLFYGEMSSVNPVVILPGAMDERREQISKEFVNSSLAGVGQFCTNPGLLLLPAGEPAEAFIAAVARGFQQDPPGVLFSAGVRDGLVNNVQAMVDAGAAVVTGGQAVEGPGNHFQNTLLRVSAQHFLSHADVLQREAFGNAALAVVAQSPQEMAAVLETLEGNLTGCIYSHTGGADDAAYDLLAPVLRQRVGRFLNDKMPTGVAVSPAMQHGGPYPAASHPHFTAVGIPASLRRFTRLDCYDNVRPHRLPEELRDKNPTGAMWRNVDGAWTQEDA